MDKYALDDFREQLLRRKRELHGRLVQIEEDLEQPMNADVPDRVTERESDEVLEGLGLAGQGEFRAIDAALNRIEAGTFGICVRCAIPYPRKGCAPCRMLHSSDLRPPRSRPAGDNRPKLPPAPRESRLPHAPAKGAVFVVMRCKS